MANTITSLSVDPMCPKPYESLGLRAAEAKKRRKLLLQAIKPLHVGP